MNRFVTPILFSILGSFAYAQQGCNLNAIRTAFTNAGCTELVSCQTGCSMYFYNPQSLSGVAAQQFAENLGANLTSIQSVTENNCISTALNSNNFGGIIWIGFTDENSEGNFYWYDGAPVNYTNWASGEPNNAGNDEDCTQIYPGGGWNDLPCNGSVSKSVIEVSLCPEISVSNDTTICHGTTLNLSCSGALLGSAPYTYVWSNGQTGQTITVSPTDTTTYTVTVTDRYGCFVTDAVTVNVLEAIDVSFISDDLCNNEVAQFSSTSSVGLHDAINGLFWDFGDGVNDVGGVVHHQYAVDGTYIVTLGVSTNMGCRDSIEQQITINTAPSAHFNFNDGCPNTLITFNDNSTTNSSVVTSWEWDFGDNSGIGGSSIENYSYATTGIYGVQLIVEDDLGCRDTSVQNVEIFEEPQPAFNFFNGCVYDEANLTDVSLMTAPDSISSWSWDVDEDGVEDYSTSTVVHQYGVAGEYDIVLTVGASNGCENSLTQTITRYPAPQANFSTDVTCINGGGARFMNTSTVSTGSIVLNNWDFGGGNGSTQESPNYIFPSIGSFPVLLEVVSNHGCVDSVIQNVNVLPKPSAGFIQDTTQGCPIMCITFSDTSNDSGGIVEWNWKFENDYGESNEQNPAYCYASSGIYDVGLIVTNVEGCMDTLENNGLITIHATPVSDFMVSPTSTDVQNATVNFTNNSIDAAAWRWDFDDGSGYNYSDYNPIHLYSDSGHYEIELIVYNANLCTDTSYQIVEILPVDDIFVPNAFSPNGDGINEVLYVRGFIDAISFTIFDRLGKKVFVSDNIKDGWDGMINGKDALEGVYTWYVKAEINGKTYKLKGDVTLIR
ncbi:MAG: PKD domain-containing protein [Flavobacteriales bacterium]|jgi:gliding motility-associated-like protein|nr:PKD domain-containing protein [Flavobacteriales bacterium]